MQAWEFGCWSSETTGNQTGTDWSPEKAKRMKKYISSSECRVFLVVFNRISVVNLPLRALNMQAVAYGLLRDDTGCP